MLAESEVFTAETLRAQRKQCLFVPVLPEQTKSFQPLAGNFLAEGTGFMKNRYLPILHNTISLCDLGGSAVKQNIFC